MSSIVTNVAALNGQRNLNSTTMKMGKVLEKLSSGYRINRAADDAAGLGISEKMRAQIRGNSQAIRNAQDGISMIQTAEGAMDEVHGILQRMRELGVQAANDTYDTAARTSIGTELVQLRSEIDRIANATQFNGQSLLTGSLTGTLGGAAGHRTRRQRRRRRSRRDEHRSGRREGRQLHLHQRRAPTTSPSPAPTARPRSQHRRHCRPRHAGPRLQPARRQDHPDQHRSVRPPPTSITAFTNAVNDVITVTGTGSAKLQVGANTTAYDTMNISFNDVRATAGHRPQPRHRRWRRLDLVRDDRRLQHRRPGLHRPGRHRHHHPQHPPLRPRCRAEPPRAHRQQPRCLRREPDRFARAASATPTSPNSRRRWSATRSCSRPAPPSSPRPTRAARPSSASSGNTGGRQPPKQEKATPAGWPFLHRPRRRGRRPPSRNRPYPRPPPIHLFDALV